MNQDTDLEPFASRRSRVDALLKAVPWVVFLVIPLTVGLMWGTYFDDRAYVVFRCARDLAAGRGVVDHLSAGSALGAGAGCQTLLRAPLYTLALALLARGGIPLPQAGLVLSVVGWGVTAVGIYEAGRAMRRSVAALVAAVLVGLSPIVVTGLGTEVSWAVAWAWLAIAASLRKRWDVQASALGLMLCTRLEESTLALAALLWALEWIERRRFPVWSGLVLAVGVMGWGGDSRCPAGHLPAAGGW